MTDWYTQREIVEKIQNLSKELDQTRIAIKKYNNLVEKMHRNEEKVSEISGEVRNLNGQFSELKYKQIGKVSAFQIIREWTPWFIAMAALLGLSL
jgi:cell fate (sporulation/competence/biofilm development) regulator YmcA (YheA/YmcA/DUF963 family)